MDKLKLKEKECVAVHTQHQMLIQKGAHSAEIKNPSVPPRLEKAHVVKLKTQSFETRYVVDSTVHPAMKHHPIIQKDL